MVKNLPANAGDIKDVGLIPELGRSPGGHGNPLQYSQGPPSHGCSGGLRTTGKGTGTAWSREPSIPGKVMFLLFNRLSRLVINYSSKEQASFNFMATVHGVAKSRA